MSHQELIAHLFTTKNHFLQADTAHELYNTHDLTLVFQIHLTYSATI